VQQEHAELHSPDWFKRSAGVSYVVAALGVTAAVIANLMLGTYLQASPTLFLFLCAIILAAWFGGYRPGIGCDSAIGLGL